MPVSQDRMVVRHDHPISSLQGDLLGRKRFSRELAALLCSKHETDSFVIGLFGAWGSGKSSLKNMVLEVLGEQADESPQVLIFNPWQWEGQAEITEAFFHELEKCLSIKSLGGSAAARSLKKFSLALGALSHAMGGMDRFVKWMLVLATTFGFGSLIDSPNWKIGIAVVSGLFLFYKELFEWFRELSDRMSDLRSGDTVPTLESRRNAVEKEMLRLKKRILVVIDDIDRLRPNEIRQIFQLVKANANFSNLTYFLLFQRDVVESGLSDKAHVGREFLDKIIQYGIDLPAIERDRLEEILRSNLGVLISIDDGEVPINIERWSELYEDFRFQFRTLRDVYRYLSTLSFHIELLKDEGVFEVNKLDLIALESIRVFQPNLFRKIIANKEALTAVIVSMDGVHVNEKSEESKKLLDQLLADVDPSRTKAVEGLLGALFPILGWASSRLADIPTTEARSEWQRDLRVCAANVFEKYFLLALPNRDLSQWRVDALIHFSARRDDLLRELRKLSDEAQLETALGKLADARERIPAANAEATSLALIDLVDQIQYASSSELNIGPHIYASRIIRSFLARDKNPSAHARFLNNLIQMSDGLSVPCWLLANAADREIAYPELKLTNVELAELTKVVASKIKLTADRGQLVDRPRLAALLGAWNRWGPPEEASGWIAAQFTTAESSLHFLRRFVVRRSREQIWVNQKANAVINLIGIDELIPIEIVKVRMSEMRSLARSDIDRMVVDGMEMFISDKDAARKAKSRLQ